jgi:parvulin-like peptidyl-prolyl isomerase
MTRRRIALFLVLVAAIGLVVAGCGGGGAKKVSSRDVAVVGGIEIPRSQLVVTLAQAQRAYKSQKRTFPVAGSAEYVALQNQIVQFLVQRAELEAKAKELGISVSEKDIDTRLTALKKQYFGGDEKKYMTQRDAQGLTEDEVRTNLRAVILSERLAKKVTADVKVSDAAVKAYYLKNLKTYTKAESRDVRHILVKTKALADSIYNQLKAGADFTALVKKYTTDTGSKATGGKYTFSRGETVPEFEKAMFALKTNEISKPVKSQFGYHVIQALSAIKPKKVQPLSQVRETIRTQLLQERKNTTMNAWVADLTKEFESKVAYATGYAPPAATTTTTG